MEGYKLLINKGLSNHFQVSHSLQLSGMGPGAYHFAATYVGSKQVSPTEVCLPIQIYGVYKKNAGHVLFKQSYFKDKTSKAIMETNNHLHVRNVAEVTKVF